MQRYCSNGKGWINEQQMQVSAMFPRQFSEDINERMQMLQQCYNQMRDKRYLMNYCYRCHIPDLTKRYQYFKNKRYPNIVQPRISIFYPNQSFRNLHQLVYSNDVKNEYIGIQTVITQSVRTVLDNLFKDYGYIPNFQRFLLFYPYFLERYKSLQYALFQQGTVDTKLAYFLALTSAIESGSSYMSVRYYNKFYSFGGDIKWITQGSYQSRYRQLLMINRLMGRAVWQINEATISKILDNGQNNWSKVQLTLCLSIMAFARLSATIALALGLNVEEEQFYGQVEQFQEFSKMLRENQFQECSQVVNQRIQKSSEKEIVGDPVICGDRDLRAERKRSEDDVESYMKEIGQELTKQQLYFKIANIFKNMLPSHTVKQKRREHRFPPIYCSDYNFTFHAYPLLCNFKQNIADKLRSLIEDTLDVTSNSLSLQGLASGKQFQKAVVYYGQNLCGYKHMEYDYGVNINKMLPINLKFYIRLLMLSPVHLTGQVVRTTIAKLGAQQCFDLGNVGVLVASTCILIQLQGQVCS